MANQNAPPAINHALICLLHFYNNNYANKIIYWTFSTPLSCNICASSQLDTAKAPDFLFLSPFFEKKSQICSWRHAFKIWTLSSAPSLVAPSLHVSSSLILAPRSWARHRRGGDLVGSLTRRSWRRASRQGYWRQALSHV